MTENEFTELYEKANNGDANAQYLIGKEYLLKSLRNEGDFVQSACEWANKSAEQNNADGLCLLGVILEDYTDNHKLAIELWEKAVELNSVHAMCNLARIYIYESNKIDEGLELLKRAAENNAAEAPYYLEYANKITPLWNFIKDGFLKEEKIFLWNKSKVEKERYISRINIQTDSEILCLTETKEKTEHSEIATFHTLTKSQFYQGYRYYMRFINGEIGLSDIKPKKCNKIILTLFHKLNELNEQYFQ